MSDESVSRFREIYIKKTKTYHVGRGTERDFMRQAETYIKAHAGGRQARDAT